MNTQLDEKGSEAHGRKLDENKRRQPHLLVVDESGGSNKM